MNLTDVLGLRAGATPVVAALLGATAVWSAEPEIDPYGELILADTPAAYWPLNERSGATAAELVNGWDGAYLGGVTPAAETTPDGAACPLFDGTNGHVRIANTDNRLQPGAAFTLELWMRHTGVWNQYDTLWGFSANNWDARINQPTVETSVTNVTFHWYDTTGAWTPVHAGNLTGTNLIDGDWHHVVATWDSTAGQRRIYVDTVGVLVVNTTAWQPARDLSGQANLGIGAVANGGRAFAGAVCRVAHYDRALTTGEIEAHYDMGSGT